MANMERLKKLAGITLNESVVNPEVSIEVGRVKLSEEIAFKKLAKQFGASYSIDAQSVGKVTIKESTLDAAKEKMDSFKTEWQNRNTPKELVTESREYKVETWFERDRASVSIVDAETDEEIVTWWDDNVRELVDDGFLNPRDWQGSAIEYAKSVGIIQESTLLEKKEKQLYALYIGKKGSGKLGIEFTGTRDECKQEWEDTKHTWKNDGPVTHKIIPANDDAPTTITESEEIFEAKATKMYGLYIGDKDSGKLGIQFTGTRDECKQEWEDTKHTWKNDGPVTHKIIPVEDDAPTTISEGHTTLPNVESDEYPARPGLEGPFRMKNGRVVYYDPKEGQYYDSKQDMYLDDAEARSLHEAIEEIAEAKEEKKEVKEPASSDEPKKKEKDDTDSEANKAEQVTVPADVKKQVNARIKEIEAAIKEFDNKGYSEGSVKRQAVVCLKTIMKNLGEGNLSGFKKAQIYFGTLMNPITELFPPKLINFLAKDVLSKD